MKKYLTLMTFSFLSTTSFLNAGIDNPNNYLNCHDVDNVRKVSAKLGKAANKSSEATEAMEKQYYDAKKQALAFTHWYMTRHDNDFLDIAKEYYEVANVLIADHKEFKKLAAKQAEGEFVRDEAIEVQLKKEHDELLQKHKVAAAPKPILKRPAGELDLRQAQIMMPLILEAKGKEKEQNQPQPRNPQGLKLILQEPAVDAKPEKKVTFNDKVEKYNGKPQQPQTKTLKTALKRSDRDLLATDIRAERLKLIDTLDDNEMSFIEYDGEETLLFPLDENVTFTQHIDLSRKKPCFKLFSGGRFNNYTSADTENNTSSGKSSQLGVANEEMDAAMALRLHQEGDAQYDADEEMARQLAQELEWM